MPCFSTPAITITIIIIIIIIGQIYYFQGLSLLQVLREWTPRVPACTFTQRRYTRPWIKLPSLDKGQRRVSINKQSKLTIKHSGGQSDEMTEQFILHF